MERVEQARQLPPPSRRRPRTQTAPAKTPRTGASKGVILKKAEEELVEVTSAMFDDVEFKGAPAKMDDDMLGVVAALANKPFCFALTSPNRRRDVYRIAHKLLHEANIYGEDLELQAHAYVTHDAIVKRHRRTGRGGQADARVPLAGRPQHHHRHQQEAQVRGII